MNKKIFSRIVLIILIIINCIVIFKFSSEKSEESNKTSGRVIEKIIQINPYTRNLDEAKKEEIKERYSSSN